MGTPLGIYNPNEYAALSTSNKSLKFLFAKTLNIDLKNS